MNILRIEVILGELYGLLLFVCNIENKYLLIWKKQKIKVYIAAGTEFEANPHDKNQIIDKYLYESKLLLLDFTSI
jgi:hypothetical protein